MNGYMGDERSIARPKFPKTGTRLALSARTRWYMAYRCETLIVDTVQLVLHKKELLMHENKDLEHEKHTKSFECRR